MKRVNEVREVGPFEEAVVEVVEVDDGRSARKSSRLKSSQVAMAVRAVTRRSSFLKERRGLVGGGRLDES